MRHTLETLLTRLFIILIAANLFILDVLIFKNRFISTTNINKTLPTPSLPITQKPDRVKLNEICKTDCMKDIRDFVTSITKITDTSSLDNPSFTNLVSEFFVPLGTGISASDDWENIVGASAYVDTDRYKNIKSIIFEASIRVPSSSQIVYVRLYNSTDKHPVWFSDMSTTEPFKLLFSRQIILDSGNKLYQVQIKTQLKGQVILDQSRIHILISNN